MPASDLCLREKDVYERSMSTREACLSTGVYLIGVCISEQASQRCRSHGRAHLTGCAHLIGVYLIGVVSFAGMHLKGPASYLLHSPHLVPFPAPVGLALNFRGSGPGRRHKSSLKFRGQPPEGVSPGNDPLLFRGYAPRSWETGTRYRQCKG
jgi:hypothetical protein